MVFFPWLSVHAVTFLGSACVKASLSRWWLLFHLSISDWMTVGSWNESGGNLYVCRFACSKWWQNYFFILRAILTLNPGRPTQLHPLNIHNNHVQTQIRPTKNRVPSSRCIVRHKPVKSVFGLVWAWGIRVGLGSGLQSFMFTHWLMGRLMWSHVDSLVFHHSADERPKIAERFRTQDTELCATSMCCAILLSLTI